MQYTPQPDERRRTKAQFDEAIDHFQATVKPIGNLRVGELADGSDPASNELVVLTLTASEAARAITSTYYLGTMEMPNLAQYSGSYHGAVEAVGTAQAILDQLLPVIGAEAAATGTEG